MGKLLDAAQWAGKIYSGGWVDGGGQTLHRSSRRQGGNSST
jgi:hypothetical protein